MIQPYAERKIKQTGAFGTCLSYANPFVPSVDIFVYKVCGAYFGSGIRFPKTYLKVEAN